MTFTVTVGTPKKESGVEIGQIRTMRDGAVLGVVVAGYEEGSLNFVILRDNLPGMEPPPPYIEYSNDHPTIDFAIERDFPVIVTDDVSIGGVE